MTKDVLGVSPASSLAILTCTLRTLRAKSAFGEALDPSLEDLTRTLLPALPDRLLPDVYLVQPLLGEETPQVGFALDAHERNYLNHHSQGTYFAATGIQTLTEPSARNVLSGLAATNGGIGSFAAADESFESRLLNEGDCLVRTCAKLGCTANANTRLAAFLGRIAALPLRVLVFSSSAGARLVVALPRGGRKRRFDNAPFRAELCDALVALGVDEGRLVALARACARIGVPCDAEGTEGLSWIATADVSHFEFAFEGGRLLSCLAGVRVSDKTVPYAFTAIRPSRSYQWHITEDCDQRCRHCYLFSEGARAHCATMPLNALVSTLDKIEERCAALHRPPAFNITGGDPLLHPQFWEFANELHRRGVHWTVMGNPFHLSDETCARLHGLGCDRYQLSLDGRRAFHDSLRKPGSFDATMAAAGMLKRAGIHVQLMATVSKRNLAEIPHCMQIANELGANAFAFARYCATSPGKAAELYPTPLEYRAFLVDYLERREAYRTAGSCCEFRLKDHLFILLARERGEFEVPAWSREHPDAACGGCHLASAATIFANGDLVACPRMESKAGSIHTDSLAAVEDGDAMRAYRDVRRIGGCSVCELLMWCRGCRAVGFGATRDAWGHDPMCWRFSEQEAQGA